MPLFVLAACAILSQVPTGVQTPATDAYPVYETDGIQASEYQSRRAALLAKMTPGSVAVFFTNPERNRNNDCDFRFRPDSTFWYLSGCEEPDSALILAPSGFNLDGKRVTEVLFVNDRNPGQETWTGYRIGPARAAGLLGVQASVSNRRFKEVLQSISNPTNASLGLPVGPTGTLGTMIADYNAWAQGRDRAEPSLRGVINRMRAIKSPDELRIMRHAAEVSALGHREAIKSCQSVKREYDLQAIVEYCFARGGCESVAYNSIVGSGENSCILHYESDRKALKPNELICMDVAGEFHGYAADVTRTFPTNGKFSPEQLAIYNIVYEAQAAGIAACKSGTSFRAPHEAARKVLEEGLKKLGIIKDAKDLGRYFMHGTSHTVGLDVHDTPIANLEPNVVLTVEPGLYIKAGSPCDPKWWNIGVRIEDDVLVTNGAPDVLSKGVPKEPSEIEKLMKRKGIGSYQAN